MAQAANHGQSVGGGGGESRLVLEQRERLGDQGFAYKPKKKWDPKNSVTHRNSSAKELFLSDPKVGGVVRPAEGTIFGPNFLLKHKPWVEELYSVFHVQFRGHLLITRDCESLEGLSERSEVSNLEGCPCTRTDNPSMPTKYSGCVFCDRLRSA